MRKSIWGLLAVVAGALLVPVAWQLARKFEAAPLSPPPPAVAPVAAGASPPRDARAGNVPLKYQAAAAAGSEAVTPQPAPARRFSDARPLREAYPELLALADGGDLAAQLHLGERLLRCSDRVMAQDRRVLDKLDNPQPPFPRGFDPTPENLAQMKARQRPEADDLRARIADCESVPADGRARGLGWIESAAQQKHPPARVAYLGAASAELGQSFNDVVANIDEVIRRRDLARRFYAEAVAECTPGVLNLPESTVNGILGIDRGTTRAAMAYASVLATRGKPSVEGFTIDHLGKQLDDLDEAQMANAEREGQALFQRCAGAQQAMPGR